MAAPADDVDGNEKSTFRCLDAARYAVALVVTVVSVAVIAHAVVVVLRPDNLALTVVGGVVTAERNLTASSPEVLFRFGLQVVNPSGRVRIYYTGIDGIEGILHGQSNASATAKDFLVFSLKNMSVAPQWTLLSEGQVHGDKESVLESYFDMFYNNGSSIITDAMLRLNGTIIAERYSGPNGNRTVDHPVVFYCWPLTIISAGDSSEETAGDRRCTEDPPASYTAST